MPQGRSGDLWATVSDKKLQHYIGGDTTDYYLPDVVTSQHYYPFGMKMPHNSNDSLLFVSGFEGSTDGWAVYNIGTLQNDNGRLKFSGTQPWSTLKKDLQLETGKKYRVRFTIDMGNCHSLSVPVYKSDISSWVSLEGSGPVSSSGTYEGTFTATSNSMILLFEMVPTGNPPPDSTGYYWLDNVSVEEVKPVENTQVGNEGYRYGFNGKEKDNDIGVADQDYGARIYDARLVRFKSVDPITSKYPELSPYQFASNTPIQAVDLDGLEKYIVHYKIENGLNVVLKVVTDNSLKYLGGPTVWDQPTIHPKVVQYIQEDQNGKVLNTTGEIPLKNFGSTLYVGAFNPKDKNGNETYAYPAMNSLDLAGKHHDQKYDILNAKGASSAIADLQTIDADEQLVLDAANVVKKYYLNKKDPITKEPISLETKDAAVKVVQIFSIIVAEKITRIKAHEASESISKTLNKVIDKINGAIKETERQLTPTTY